MKTFISELSLITTDENSPTSHLYSVFIRTFIDKKKAADQCQIKSFSGCYIKFTYSYAISLNGTKHFNTKTIKMFDMVSHFAIKT